MSITSTGAVSGFSPSSNPDLENSNGRASKTREVVETVLFKGENKRLPPPLIGRILRLELPKKPQIEEAKDAQQLFREFRDIEADKLINFSEANIKDLYELMRKLVLTNHICFHDLIALHCDRLLSQLKGHTYLEEGQLSKWRHLFFGGYLGLFRTYGDEMKKNVPVSEATDRFFWLPSDYAKLMDTYTKNLKGQLDQNHMRKLGKLRKKTNQEELFKNKILPLYYEFVKVQDLMSQFLLQPSQEWAGHLLAGESLICCPSTEKMNPSTKEQISQVVGNLCQYVSLMSETLNGAKGRAVIGIEDINFFKSLFSSLSIFKKLSEKEILSKSWEIVSSVSNRQTQLFFGIAGDLPEQIEKARDNKLTHEQWCEQLGIYKFEHLKQDEFVESMLQTWTIMYLSFLWLDNVRWTLEHSVISILDPDHRSNEVRLNRMFLVLQHLVQSLNSPPEQTPSGDRLQQLRKDCAKRVSEKDDYIQALFEGNNHQINFPILRIWLVPMQEMFKDIAKRSMQEIASMETEWGDPSEFFEKTLWLCRIFILTHDIEILFHPGQTPDEDSMLPLEYLNLLIPVSPKPPAVLAEETISASSLPSSTVDMPSPFLLESPPSVEEDFGESNLQDGTAVPSSEAIPGPSFPKKKPKKRETASHSEAVDPFLSEANEILQLDKRRKIVEILHRLGLKPIGLGKGSHEVFAHRDDKTIQTTVPRGHRGEIPRGTVHAIHRQITEPFLKKAVQGR